MKTLVNDHSGVVIANSVEQERILREKLEKRVVEGGVIARPFLNKIEQDGNMLADYIVPLGAVQSANMSFSRDDAQVFMDMRKHRMFTIHPHAIAQLGEKLGIPPAYLRDLTQTEWGRTLAVDMLNAHTKHTARQRALVRVVGDQVRGVLSDSYRRLSSPNISAAFIRACAENGAKIAGAYADDTRMWIEAILMRVVPISTEKNGVLHVAYGARWSTSDFGDGAHDLRTWWMHVWCLNTAVSETMLHQVHLGSRIPDDIVASDRTYRLDTKTQASFVKDIVAKVFSVENIERHARLIQASAKENIDPDEELKKLRKGGQMLQGEIEEVRRIITNGRLDDGMQGENTLWKLSQSISAVGRVADERRKRELEELAGRLLKPPTKG
jgi:hypothetical protein